MSFNLTYGLLFEVTFLHNYFLNDGVEIFDGMSPADKEKMMQKFSTDSFLSIAPTQETKILLGNYKMVFKKNKTGFRIYIKVKEADPADPFIGIPASVNLNFLITATDYRFTNYTNLEFAADRIFLFANVKPATEPVTFKDIPAMGESTLISNNYLASAATTAGLSGQLRPSEKQDVFGIISLTTQGGDPLKNIVDGSGRILGPHFKVHFDNRKTLWRYIDRKAATQIETQTPKPLTYSGFVKIAAGDFTPAGPDIPYPNPSVKSVTKTGSDYYSEIFI